MRRRPCLVGLIGAEDPPLSPALVGQPPSNFEAPPVPVRSFETLLAERGQSATVGRSRCVASSSSSSAAEQLELADYDDRECAVAAARELMLRFSTAES